MKKKARNEDFALLTIENLRKKGKLCKIYTSCLLIGV